MCASVYWISQNYKWKSHEIVVGFIFAACLSTIYLLLSFLSSNSVINSKATLQFASLIATFGLKSFMSVAFMSLTEFAPPLFIGAIFIYISTLTRFGLDLVYEEFGISKIMAVTPLLIWALIFILSSEKQDLDSIKHEQDMYK